MMTSHPEMPFVTQDCMLLYEQARASDVASINHPEFGTGYFHPHGYWVFLHKQVWPYSQEFTSITSLIDPQSKEIQEMQLHYNYYTALKLSGALAPTQESEYHLAYLRKIAGIVQPLPEQTE